jgi:hypothetical protein
MSVEGTVGTIPKETIEALRLILVREQSREIDEAEASEIGESLLTFYELLGQQSETDDERCE